MKLNKTERQNQIYELVASKPETSLAELAAEFGCSQITIRRDISLLVQEKRIVSTHGGYVTRSEVGIERPYLERIKTNYEEKSKIGQAAAVLVKEGDRIFINDGSTLYHLVRHLPDVKITIYTNSLAYMNELNPLKNVRVYIVGGEMSRDHLCLMGPLTDRMLESLHADKAFLGADGINDKGMCTASDLDMARTAEVMMKCSDKSYLLADHTKFNLNGGVAYAQIEDIDVVVTAGKIPTKFKKIIKKTGELIIAKSSEKKF
jgi:DeoR/GlpR family transcriptional regulator of sugar metabolism